jgi:hypothetical protein
MKWERWELKGTVRAVLEAKCHGKRRNMMSENCENKYIKDVIVLLERIWCANVETARCVW